MYATKKIGGWSAAAATVFALIYVVGQLLEWQGVLGSAGGPESASTPLGIAVLLAPSFFLGSAFVIMMAALHVAAPEEKKAFSLSGLSFAIMYATLVSMVYFMQLTLVAPRLAADDMAGIEFLRFVPYRSFLFAVDLLGYSFMSVATLLASFALPRASASGVARVLLFVNGLLLPFIGLQMYYPQMIWIAALWGLTFPAASAAVCVMFFRSGRGLKEDA